MPKFVKAVANITIRNPSLHKGTFKPDKYNNINLNKNKKNHIHFKCNISHSLLYYHKTILLKESQMCIKISK